MAPPSGSDAEGGAKDHPHDRHHDPLVLFGLDLSDRSPPVQFLLCASGVFSFTIVYGYLQELLAVRIAGRRFGLFLATAQFAGYAFWSFVLTRLRHRRRRRPHRRPLLHPRGRWHGDGHGQDLQVVEVEVEADGGAAAPPIPAPIPVPLRYYVALSLIRAIDLGMTNLAMQFVNYPAKTLIKSSRVVFTMLLGLLIGNRTYRTRDYAAVSLLVLGLGIFLHADSRSSVVFHPLGVVMLIVSLTCDGTLNNWSEVIMREYRTGQDEFQLQLYSIALVAMTIAAHLKGELILGIRYFMLSPGTVSEIELGTDDTTWTAMRKINVLILFSTTGLLGSSCAGAITKRFGALSMSITSTARKAMTLFLSFVAFPNKCTVEHVAGMVIFLSALLMKSLGAHRGNADGEAGKGSVDGGGAQPLRDNPLAKELDELGPGEEEMRPLTALESSAETADGSCRIEMPPVDIESGPTGDREREYLLSHGDLGGSLFETARRSRRLMSLFSYLPRLQRSMKSSLSHESHSS